MCKNKNRGETMKHLEKLIELKCFTRQEVVQIIGNEPAAHSLLHDYLKMKYIERIRRNLYTAISLESKQPIANRFMIASKITENSYVSFHSAFEYYGYANQVFYEVYVMSNQRFADFDFDGVTFTRIFPQISSGVIETASGVRVTDLERTVIDSIHSFEKVGGLEELLRCLSLVPSLRTDKLLEYLEEYGLANLYQKSGFILQQFSKQLGISDKFFETCKNKAPASKKYLYTAKDSLSENFVLHEDWRLYAPEDFKSILNKGVEFND